MKMSRLQGALLAVAASLTLAACGGGGIDRPPPGGPDAPPASAGASSEGFLAFIASLADRNFDRSEPYDLSMFEAPAASADTDTAPPVGTKIDG